MTLQEQAVTNLGYRRTSRQPWEWQDDAGRVIHIYNKNLQLVRCVNGFGSVQLIDEVAEVYVGHGIFKRNDLEMLTQALDIADEYNRLKETAQ
jgi:hypothetical protein